MPAEWRGLGFLLLVSLNVSAAESPPTPNMDLIEFLGSLETNSASGTDVLTAIDTGLLPELPEEPPHETK